MDKVGAWSDVKTPDKVQHICDQLKPEVEKKEGKNYKVFDAIEYRDQIVAGVNYLIKVFVGEDQYLHLLVYRDLSGKNTLMTVKKARKDDPLTPLAPLM